MDPLQSNEAIQQLLKLLEENGRQNQSADLSQLMWYMDGMMRQFDAVTQELQSVKFQLAQEKQPTVKKAMRGVVANLENKVQQTRDILDNLREKITDCAKNAVENFRELGVSALDKAVSGLHIKNTLESLQEHISDMAADTRRNIQKVESIGYELRSVGGHLKNAGLVVTGKDTQIVDGGHEGRFQSVVLAPMRTTRKLLSSMNNATLAAIGNVEHLEEKAEDVREIRAEKKASVRQMLADKKAEAAARSAPAPDKERKSLEAAL